MTDPHAKSMLDAVGSPGEGLRMYDEMADWFHLLSAPGDYAEEAAYLLGLFRWHVNGLLGTMLELGSGGGNTASHLRADVQMTLTDLSEPMLALSRTLNPGCEHLVADMRTARLGRTFDAVLIHDAVMYMATTDDLAAALSTAFAHVRPGGAAIIAPDCVTETFKPRTNHGGHDGDGRALRYLEWTYDPDPSDASYLTDFALLLRDGRDEVRIRYDRHVMGLFPRATWLDLLRGAGFEPSATTDPWERDVFIGVRPA